MQLGCNDKESFAQDPIEAVLICCESGSTTPVKGEPVDVLSYVMHFSSDADDL